MLSDSRQISVDRVFQSQGGGQERTKLLLQAEAQPLTFVPVCAASVHIGGLSYLGNASTGGITSDSCSGCLNIQSQAKETLVRLHFISAGRKYV